MDEYLDLIQIFFDEKLMFLTDEKQYSCNDCSDKKKFIEKSAPGDIEGGRGEIILSCGDTKSDKSKCGNKIRIILPIYSSNKDLNFLKNKLNKMINWDIIKEFIDVDESVGVEDVGVILFLRELIESIVLLVCLIISVESSKRALILSLLRLLETIFLISPKVI